MQCRISSNHFVAQLFPFAIIAIFEYKNVHNPKTRRGMILIENHAGIRQLHQRNFRGSFHCEILLKKLTPLALEVTSLGMGYIR